MFLQNYFVVCEPQASCPPVDDCYMLEKKHGCCEKCKGTYYYAERQNVYSITTRASTYDLLISSSVGTASANSS